MKIYRFTFGIGFPGAEHEDEFEYDHEPSQKELENDWKDWVWEFVDGGFGEVEDKE